MTAEKILIKIIFGFFPFQLVFFVAGKPCSQAEFNKLLKKQKPIVLPVYAKWCDT